MPTPFADSPDYRAEIRSILQLHRMWQEGKGESPEADALRDATVGHWDKLSDAERRRLQGLSEDLNDLSEHLRDCEPEGMNPQAREKLDASYAAKQQGQWDRSLELLRRWGKHLPPSVLAFLRGSVWWSAEDLETAVCFFEHAARLDPTNSNYQSIVLDLLQRTDPARGLVLAEVVLADPLNHQMGVVVHAVHALFGSTQALPVSDARPTLQKIVDVLTECLARLENEAEPDELATFAACSMLGLAHDCLGNHECALSFYSRALQIDADDDALLAAKDRLLCRTSTKDSLDLGGDARPMVLQAVSRVFAAA